MSEPDLVRAVRTYVERFNAGDRASWLELFADDASVEDPVGTDPHNGREAIGAFWDLAHALADDVELELLEPVNPCGQEVAFVARIISRIGDDRYSVPVIETQAYDDSGRITAMRAFWSMTDMAPHQG